MRFATLLSVPLILAVTLPAFSQRPRSMDLPKACIPKYMAASEVKSVATLAVVSYKGSNYYYLGVDGKRKSERLRAIVRVNQQCYLSFVDPGEAYSLSEGVPMPVAKTLAVVAHKNAIQKRGGLRSYQAWYSRQNFTNVAPEDAFALKQLGVKLSSKAKVLPWAKIKEKELLIGGNGGKK
jgi:hypothetical protein